MYKYIQKKITVCHSDQSNEAELPLPMLCLHYITESSCADIKIIQDRAFFPYENYNLNAVSTTGQERSCAAPIIKLGLRRLNTGFCGTSWAQSEKVLALYSTRLKTKTYFRDFEFNVVSASVVHHRNDDFVNFVLQLSFYCKQCTYMMLTVLLLIFIFFLYFLHTTSQACKFLSLSCKIKVFFFFLCRIAFHDMAVICYSVQTK